MSKVFPLISRSKNTNVRQPKEVACFSRHLDGSFSNDASELAYYYLPNSYVSAGIDLQSGFEKFEKFDSSKNGQFDGFLNALTEHERKNSSKVKSDIVTWRGIMTKLLTLPYDNRDLINLNIVRFDGQIFIQLDTKTEMAKSQKDNEMSEKLEFSGYKFEKMATLSQQWSQCTRKEIEKRHKETVNNCEQFCSIVKTAIGKVGILMGGEVDCVWDFKSEKDPLPHYVELKTSRAIEHPGHAVTFERKLYKTWAQCFLIGVRKIVYGFRDEQLVLRTVEDFATEEVPLLLKNSPLHTTQQGEQAKKKSVNKCMDSLKFYAAVMEWLVENVPEDEDKVWRFSYNPDVNRDYLTLTEMTPEMAAPLLDDDNESERILTKEFKQWRRELKEVKQ